jgi:hypothetical protein
MTRGKQPVSPVGPLPSSAPGSPAAFAISSARGRVCAAPAMSVVAAKTGRAERAAG